VPEALARDVATAVMRLRSFDIAKRPGVAETIDWAHAVSFLGVERLDEETALATLGAVLKDHDDQELAVARMAEVVGGDGNG
jgi:FAD/FMN-containing dehydrogenase